MSNSTQVFESMEIKRDYVIILTNWIIENYNVADNATKREIFDIFYALEDEKLLEKGGMIEDFVSKSLSDMKNILSQATYLLHSIEEEQERSELVMSF